MNFENVLYIEGLKDYVKIYLNTEQKQILTLMTLRKLEEELPKNNFMRVHRSYIVALDKIEQIERINRLSIIRESIFPKRTAMISGNLWKVISFCNCYFQSFYH